MSEVYQELEELIENDYKSLYGMVYRMTENHQDTEDVLQNTFLKAYKYIEGFNRNAKLSTWVYRIAINEGYRHLKSWNKLPLVMITEDKGISEEQFFRELEYEPSFDDKLIMEEIREKCLHGFLKCVPKRMRVCFLLKTCLNLSMKEIAEVMEITEGSAKITLYRGRKLLKEMFEMRCSLIDPDKPCKCYLWIRFMNENNLPLPEGYHQYKDTELQKEHFKKMSFLKKIDYMYHVEEQLSKEEFTNKLRKLVEIL